MLSFNIDRNLQKLVHDELKDDGIINATQQHINHNTTKYTLPNFHTTDIQGKQIFSLITFCSRVMSSLGSKIVRLVRAKQATKRKTSLDTLIEVVQKELLRVNSQTNSISPPSSSKFQNRPSQSTSTPHRSMISSVLPSSHPGSLTSQSFKITRKRGMMNFNHSKKIFFFFFTTTK